MSTCKSCQRPILWATTEAGRAIPLDPEPRLDGNLVLVGGTAYHVGPESRGSMHPRHVSHFSTCPQADGHRKERRR